jgi:hypothetical protein
MKFNNKNPVIVGSGPSAAIVAEFLVSRGLFPTIFDAHSNRNINKIEAEDLKNLGFKSHLKSFNSYYQSPCSNIHYGKNFMARQSFKFGGFSRVWGGTLSFFSDINLWPQEIRPNSQDYAFTKHFLGWDNLNQLDHSGNLEFDYPQNYISKMNNRSKNLSAQTSRLAIAHQGFNKCINLNDCLNGCSVDSIWFAGNSLKKLIDTQKVDYRPDSFLHSIRQVGNKTLLLFQNEKLEYFEVESIQAYIGLGPIGTAALMIRSNVFSEINIKDSHTVFALAFSLGKKNYPKTTNLSKWWVTKNKGLKISAQIYSPDFKFAQVAALKMPKIIPFRNMVARLLVPYMHPMLIYFDASISGSIKVEENRSEIIVNGILPKKSKNLIRKSINSLFFDFAKIGLYIPTFVIKIGSAGTGFHSGSFLKYGQHINESAEISNFPGIHFIDSSTLPSIEPGSITPTIMLNAVRIARTTLEKDLNCYQ